MSTTGGGWVGAIVAAGMLAATASCSTDGPLTAPAPAAAADEAALRLADLRARFVVAAPAEEARAVIGAGVVSSFEIDGDRARARVPVDAKRGVRRPATVSLPLRASGPVRLEDDATQLAVTFELEGAVDAPLTTTGGIALYPGALAGADVVHRVHPEGIEDYVVFEQRPAREELRYRVDVSRVAGLRLVADTLELLDAGGAPRLRVAPPSVVDAGGVSHAATLAVEGCAYDTSPSGPWGRPVTEPAAARCGVRVAWAGVDYPAIVDPAWVATGSMTTVYYSHTATVLGDGRVLVAGGVVTVANLFDPASATFSPTGSMSTTRYEATATLLLTGRVLVAGGGSTPVATTETYDPASGTFSPSASMGTPRHGHAAALLLSGKVLVAGGYIDAGSGYTNKAELYDPGSNTFAPVGPMGVAREYPAAIRLGAGKVLVGCGGQAYSDIFDPATNTFGPAGSMTAALDQCAASLLLSGSVLFTGGAGSSPFAQIYNGAFSATGPMSTGRYGGHTSSVLPSGKVVVAGGQLAGALNSVDLYDPATGVFTPTGSMINPRYGHAAVTLASGKVLVTGGGSGAVESSAEIFDQLPAGGGCSLPSECKSGVCIGGICCVAACNPSVCMTCAAGSGACVPVTNAPGPGCGGTCNAAGVCKASVGQPCPGGNGDCANGICTDGVCCNTACSGACDVCALALGASADGTCTVLPAGNVGAPSCAPYLCSGTAACAGTCASDSGCVAGTYCDATGACVPIKQPGAACKPATDCKSPPCRECPTGFCVDGVCCDSGCTGPCQACAASLKESGTGDGTCGAALHGTDPHDRCPTDPQYPYDCKADGLCDASGACRTVAPADTLCSTTATCTAGSLHGSFCDPFGTCQTGLTVPCGLYACASNTACHTSCAADTDCSVTAGAYCDTAASECKLKQPNAAACTSGTQCNSGYCFDGVCCNQACAGLCQACSVGANKGACVPITGDPSTYGHPACPGAGSACGGACDGADTSTCHFPGAGSPCGAAAACNGDVSTAAQACDGAGTCAPPVSKNCTPYACDATSGGCKQTCASATDCAQGATCDTAAGKCASATGTCLDPFTAQGTDGQVTSCAPYRCTNGACATHCASSTDCADGATCTGGTCVPGTGTGGGATGSPGHHAGCGCRTSSRESGGAALFLLLLSALVARRRPRRRAVR